MKSWTELLDDRIAYSLKRGYDTLYIAIDWHDTICYGSYSNDLSINFVNEFTLPTLQKWTLNTNIKLILYTSSQDRDIVKFIKYMTDLDVNFEFINENPDVCSKGFGNFDSKFYFDLLLDDKAGFEPEDWKELYYYD